MTCLYFYLLLKKNKEFVSGRKGSIYPVIGEISGIWHRKGRIQLFTLPPIPACLLQQKHYAMVWGLKENFVSIIAVDSHKVHEISGTWPRKGRIQLLTPPPIPARLL